MPSTQNPVTSGVLGNEPSRWIVAQRPQRNTLDPFKPHGFFSEEERCRSGNTLSSAVILLTNKECPWRCLMCDLWKNTLTYSVPSGAIPKQIQFALDRLGFRPEQIKLYNSGSFFDAAAVPVADYAAIAQTVSCACRVVVESHPRLVGQKALRFRDLLFGNLEVAMGLETIHPTVLPRLNKRFDLAQFRHAADLLGRAGIGVRAFVLIKPPFLNEEEGIEWAVKSAAFAFDCGVEVVSLIPTRPGNGALERLIQTGEFTPPRLASLEQGFEQALGLARGRVFADTWDLEQFSACSACLDQRRRRLQAMNLQQRILPPIVCAVCAARDSISTS